MPSLFNEEHFIDKYMVEIVTKQEQYILDEMCKASIKMGVHINKERLQKWLKLCMQLENIDQTALIDIATRKKFTEKNNIIAQKDKEINILQKALRLACADYYDVDMYCYHQCNKDCCSAISCDYQCLVDYYKNKAESQ